MFTRSRRRVLRAVTALTIAAGAFVGATGTAHAALNTYIPVSMTADGHGYATISTVGKVTARGTVAWRGDPHGFTGQMVGIAVTAKGDGYMAISDHGQVYSFGNVAYHGNPTGFTGKIVGISITADGKGYVAMSDHGQVYAYGTAKYHANPTGYSGSMARIAVTGDGLGYVAVSSTGQVYAYGTVKYRGNPKVTSPVSGIAVTADGKGYAVIEWNGTVHTAGTVTWRGNPKGFTGIMTSIAVDADGHGYLGLSSSGQMYAFNTPYLGNADPGTPDPVCVNPFAGEQSNWTLERTDQGVDFGAKIPMPVRAICDGDVVSTYANGWPGGNHFIVFKFSAGDFKGKCVFIAEHLTDIPAIGTHVKAGQPIATAVPGSPDTEWGWAQGPGTPSTPYNGAPDGTPMPGGQAFARFLRSLGAQTLQDPGPGPLYAGNTCP